jgi:hypothetical protein
LGRLFNITTSREKEEDAYHAPEEKHNKQTNKHTNNTQKKYFCRFPSEKLAGDASGAVQHVDSVGRTSALQQQPQKLLQHHRRFLCVLFGGKKKSAYFFVQRKNTTLIVTLFPM